MSATFMGYQRPNSDVGIRNKLLLIAVDAQVAAKIDRLVHHSYLLPFDGPSNRMRDSLMRIQA